MTLPDAATRLESLAHGIADVLAKDFDPRHGFGETEFYGTAFACMLWRRWPERFREALEAGLARLAQQDKRARIGVWQNPYHWEFVRFALADLFRAGPVGDFRAARQILGSPRFVGTRVANWMLLRSTVRIAEGGWLGTRIGRLERALALGVYQKQGGFIEDQRGAPTQQYHAFMTALLGYQIVVLGEPSARLRDRFAEALAALQGTTLLDGEVNAVGRGRFQSFGYAAAALALAFGLRLGLAAPGAHSLLAALTGRLERAAGSGGRLPLMITGVDARTDIAPPPVHPHQNRIGWHSYNNGPDYLAFSGAILKLAAEQLDGIAPPLEPAPLGPEDRLVDGLRVVRSPAYAAIASLPHAALVPAQPLPFIVTQNGARPLPSYGGEALPDSIYTALALPLPVFEGLNGGFRDIVDGTLFRWAGPDRIVGERAAFRFERKFRFGPDMIAVEDALILKEHDPDERLHLPWLPLPEDADRAADSDQDIALAGARLECDLPLAPVETAAPQYGMSGRLRIWSAVAAPPPPGEIARAAYRIRLTP